MRKLYRYITDKIASNPENFLAFIIALLIGILCLLYAWSKECH